MNRYLLAVVLAALPLLASAQAAAPASPYLATKGHAERSVQPDRFGIDLRVIVVDMKPAVARTRAETKMAGVLAGFKAHHAIPESIDATSLRVGAKSEFRDGENVFIGTEVWRTAHAVFANLNDLRDFIDGVDADRELQITGTTVTRSDIESVRQDVRRAAINDSIRSAKAMAEAYGVRLGALYTVSDQPNAILGGVAAIGLYAPAALEPAAKIDLKVGSIKVEQDVFAIYLMDAGK
jgi:uncharacterized protein YggE